MSASMRHALLQNALVGLAEFHRLLTEGQLSVGEQETARELIKPCRQIAEECACDEANPTPEDFE